nr:unnamed protein product [Digitaria exilis]
MLSEVSWHNNFGYDPTRHHLAVSGHHLRRLEIRADSSGLKLMRQFNIVDELHLNVHVMEGIQEYKRFLEGTDKLARCEVLVIRFMKMEHSFKSAMLHLLRQCTRVRKLVVQVTTNMDDYPCKLLSKCPCSLPENPSVQPISCRCRRPAFAGGGVVVQQLQEQASCWVGASRSYAVGASREQIIP